MAASAWKIERLHADSDTGPGERLDQWLAGRLSELSRTRIRQLIDIGGVHLNGRRMRRCSHPVAAGDRVEVYQDGLPLSPFTLTKDRILFRDEYLLVLDKPPGLDTQPTPARFKGTLYQGILDLLGHDPRRRSPGLGMLQRLDRDTSGVMVFSLHPRAHKALTLDFRERRVEKRYSVLVAGTTAPEGEIRSLLARRRRDNRVHSVERGGKAALTRFRRIEELRGASFLEVDLLTGRSHQIRAHFTEKGHPVLGDERYGGPTELEGTRIPRQMIHALTLGLHHPVSGQEFVFEAPAPADMNAVLAALRPHD